MENKGLLFIPDISGFTRFISETEIDHSRLIIQELLEVIINSNEIGLKVSEIEGDAVLFYRFGEPPSIEEVYKQVEKMFCEFHRSIIAYAHRRYCLCKACNSVTSLTLKVITHYGEFTGYSVQNFNKLIGKDIIVAHQLLKNDIDKHEYWLVTNSLVNDPSQFRDFTSEKQPWMSWNTSAKQTETGYIPFYFTLLSPLKEQVTVQPLPRPPLEERSKVLSFSREYPTDFITLFHAAGDFALRDQWRDGVKKVEVLDNHLPRIGMRCKTEFDNGEAFIYASSYFPSEDRLEFSETNESDGSITYYTIDKLAEKRSSLKIDYYVNKGFANNLIFNIFKKKKTEESLKKSMLNLDELARTLVIPS
jgi:hypothetical protein